MSIAQDEIFGPVLSVIPFKGVDQAVQIANDSIYGLAGAFWSRNINTAHKVTDAIRVSTMGINNYFGATLQCPLVVSSKAAMAAINPCMLLPIIPSLRQPGLNLNKTCDQNYWAIKSR